MTNFDMLRQRLEQRAGLLEPPKAKLTGWAWGLRARASMAYQVMAKDKAAIAMNGRREAITGDSPSGAIAKAQAPNQKGKTPSSSGGNPIKVGCHHRLSPWAKASIWPNAAMSQGRQGSRPKKPGTK